MSNYNEILRQVESLSPEEQIRLLEDVAKFMRRRVNFTPKPKRSILELEGLGKEVWEGIDAQEYVDRERGKWNG
ncbi:MAG: hypothetical protein F6J93_35645 [Oscillatoria sp. SIO1A7]|nr:hypothetical protein [Oscillatoria sp. SIO1A7]